MIKRCMKQKILANIVQYKSLDRGPYLFREEHGPEINQYCGQNSYILTSVGINSVTSPFFVWPPSVVTNTNSCTASAINNAGTIQIYFQQDATLHSLFISGKLHYIIRAVSPPIIRSTHDCIYSIWYLSNRYCYLPL